MNTVQFGYHLTLDLYDCNPEKLGDMKTCYDALDKLPGKIDMIPLTSPYMVSAISNEEKGGKDPGGYTGFIIIAESHISLHTFVKRGFVSIDVYSCKTFDKEKAKAHFIEIFEPKDIEEHYIDRGLRYPTENIYE